MALGSQSVPTPVAWWHVAAIAFGICALTNGPTIWLTVHALGNPLSLDDWTYVFPVQAVGLIGVWWLARDGLRPASAHQWVPVVLLAAYIAVICASATWSVNSIVTAQRSLLTAGTMVFAFGLARQGIHVRRVGILIGTHCATLASALVVVIAPSIGRAQIDAAGKGGYAQGIFANRNSLGAVCAVALLTACFSIVVSPSGRQRQFLAVLAVVDVWLLVDARSATALIAASGALALLGAVGSIAWLRRRYGTKTTVQLAAGAAAVTLIVSLLARNQIAAITGRDSTLSGRRDIWKGVYSIAKQRPYFGHGFWSFWDTPQVWELYNGSPSGQFGSAHNSLLETLLGTGWIGVASFSLILLSAGIGSVWRFLKCPGWDSAFWLAIFAFCAVECTMESFTLWHSYVWVLMCACATIPWLSTPAPAGATVDPHGHLTDLASG